MFGVSTMFSKYLKFCLKNVLHHYNFEYFASLLLVYHIWSEKSGVGVLKHERPIHVGCIELYNSMRK